MEIISNIRLKNVILSYKQEKQDDQFKCYRRFIDIQIYSFALIYYNL